MAIRNIREDGDEILRKISKPVTVFDRKLWELLDDMADTMAEANGAGLAAVQVGVLRRAFVVDVGDGLMEFVNPQILEASGEQTGVEGCLSFPGQWGMVTRPNHIKIKAQDRHGSWFEAEGEGLCARAMIHEAEHLDGKVFTDTGCRMLSEDEAEKLFQKQK